MNFTRVRRANSVVHVVELLNTTSFSVDAVGRVIAGGTKATMLCGRKAKLYPGGRNRFTQDAPTCIVCAAKDNTS